VLGHVKVKFNESIKNAEYIVLKYISIWKQKIKVKVASLIDVE